MRASQKRMALLGAGIFLISNATIACLQQSYSDRSASGAKSPQTAASERVAPGVRLGDYPFGGAAAAELSSRLSGLAPHFFEQPQNARKEPESLNLIPERPGRELDIEHTKQKLLQAKTGERVDPVLKTVQPQVTIAELQTAAPATARLIGQFSTPILDRTPDRVENIRVTASLLNNAVVEPGQEFSFNKIVGMPTEAKGFKPGTVFGEGGELRQELGGGMCQISSTLYNVALNTGLEITERHPHSKPVAYVEQGRDATIYDDKDFRFRNTLANPMIIKSWVGNGRVHVAFYESVKEPRK